MISRKFAYADDLALLHSSGNWKDLEGTLSQDMSTLSAYLQTWRLKLSHTKTVTAGFHLNNREAKRELKVYNNGRLLPFCPTPTYLGVKLDRSLTFRHHLVALRKKLSSRVTLLRRLVGSGCCAGAKTLRIATLSLVYSAAEYCAPVWCRSTHTRLIDSVLNDALRIVTGCLRPIPTETHLRHSVVSLGKTLYGTFPCLVVLTSSSKLQSYLYQITSGQQYLGISGSRSGYLLTLCITPPSLSCESGG